MSAQKFTPAPWLASHDEVDDYSDVVAVGAGTGGASLHLCDITQPNHKANARLIAAAPELLAALVQLVADIGGTSHCQDCDEADRCACWLTLVQAHAAVARAVIARATGGEL